MRGARPLRGRAQGLSISAEDQVRRGGSATEHVAPDEAPSVVVAHLADDARRELRCRPLVRTPRRQRDVDGLPTDDLRRKLAPFLIHGADVLSPMHHPTCRCPLFAAAFMSARVMWVSRNTMSVPSPVVAWKKMLLAKISALPGAADLAAPGGNDAGPQPDIFARRVALVPASDLTSQPAPWHPASQMSKPSDAFALDSLRSPLRLEASPPGRACSPS